MSWYKGRHRKQPGEVARTVHLTLSAEDWAWWEEIARHNEEHVGYTLSLHLTALVVRQKQMALEERQRRQNSAAELFALDKARNGDDSWQIRE